jgi:CPA1 family monovalent cation:H+ antiporter
LTGAQSRLEALAFWKTLLFIINGLVFTLIGLQMPAVMRGLQGYSWPQLTLYGFTVVFVVMAVRFVWMFPATYLPGKVFPSIARETAPRWGVVTTLSWVGMRGIVSLAAALSIPLSLPSDEEFPFRNLLVFLTYVVILATLLIPATTLPWLMRRLGIKEGGEARRDETVARLALFQAALQELDLLKRSSAFSEQLLENTAAVFKRRIQELHDNLEPGPLSPVPKEEHNLRQLTQRVLKAERNELGRLRQQATIHDAVFFQLARELDLDEARLRHQQIFT